MKNTRLINQLAKYVSRGTPLLSDSTQIQGGWVFVALKGRHHHGVQFVDQAIRKGAACLLIEGKSTLLDFTADQEGAFWYELEGIRVPVIFEEQLSENLGDFAYHWYQKVADSLKIIAVTGTNGKTSTVHFIHQLCKSVNVSCATLGTLGLCWPDGHCEKGSLTTPDVLSVHHVMACLCQKGVQVLALEASSIGLEQGRLQGVPIQYAGFINLTQDHLDYHQTMQVYGEAKSLLFQFSSLRYACINQDDPWGMSLIAHWTSDVELETLSLQSKADCQVQVQNESINGIQVLWNHSLLELSIHGRYNVYNLFLALSLVSKALEKPFDSFDFCAVQPPKGRLQPIVCDVGGQGPLVFVDYAHTPDALENVLKTITVMMPEKAKLHCIFGCGGGRDKTKRPLMGAVVSKYADEIYLTSDNPRDEVPEKIIQEIQGGLSRPLTKKNVHRAEMILDVLLNADPQDVVLIAGKGHETEQIVGDHRSFFDDAQWAYAGLFLRHYPTVSRDTRTVKKDELLLVLKGERFDAHQHLNTLSERPGLIVLEHRGTLPQNSDIPVLQVTDVVEALQRMAKLRRQSMDVCVVGIAGSNGKTSLKEMTACIFQTALGQERVLKTQGNLNNHIGVPLTLMSLRPEHQVAIIEMGMNHPGEMRVLSEMVRPNIAIVNNAQREHQEFMHSVQAVAKENGTLFEYLSPQGVAIFHDDVQYRSIWVEQSQGHEYRTFGVNSSQADVHSNCFHFNGLTGMDFKWVYQGKEYETHLPVLGQHHVHNALGAMSIALVYGLSIEKIIEGLSSFSPVKGRMQLKPMKGVLWIDDTYNANPDSVCAAIDVLVNCPAPRCLVLGDMGEVGEQGPHMHQEVGAYAKERGIELLVGVGVLCAQAVQAFGSSGVWVSSVSEIDLSLFKQMRTVLVKGSRSMRMETLLDRIKEV